VSEYTNQEQEDILTEQGRDPTELRKQADEAARAQAPTPREGDLPRGAEPTQIMERQAHRVSGWRASRLALSFFALLAR
jgi:hypothetical protein